MNNQSIGPVLAIEMRSRSAMATGHVCASAVHQTKITIDHSKPQPMNNRSIGPVLAMETRSQSAMATGHVCARATVHQTKITIDQSKIITHEQSINRAGFGNGDEVPVRHGHRPRLRLRSPSKQNYIIDQSKSTSHEQSINRAGLGDVDKDPVRHGHRPRLRLRSPSNQNYNRSIKDTYK
jgi:hypothetical protein